MSRGAVLEKVNALPCAEGQLALVHRYGKICVGEGRSDVRGHIVGAFGCVPVKAVVVGHKAAEEIV